MDKIEIGKVLKPQGIRGEVKVLPLTGDTEIFDDLKYCYTGAGKLLTVRDCVFRQGSAYILFEGVGDRNGAEALRGAVLSVDKADVPISEGSYFISDLIGCKLLDEKGNNLGVITAVDKFGAADVITVKTLRGVARFPFIEALDSKIDIEKKTMAVLFEKLSEVIIDED